jgi:DNA polymerase elongation subunit (family B)
MAEFYTAVHCFGDTIAEIYYKDGKRHTRKTQFLPSLFAPSLTKVTPWRSLEGLPLDEFCPGSISECKDTIEQYSNVANFQIYGNTDWTAQYIAKTYPGEVEYDYKALRVGFLDIETESEDGFPSISDPNERINAITIETDGKRVSFALNEFDLPGVECHVFGDERSMLRAFLEYWELHYPDIITGWNIRFFDIPYIYGRIAKLFDEKTAKRLSPFKKIQEKIINRKGKDHTVFDLLGVATLDYYELYIKFTYTNRESYALNHIAQVELGEKKLDYTEHDSIREFYTNDFQKFMEYNSHDVTLVQKLDKKLKLLELVVALAYNAKVNFTDTFSQVKTWDCIIYHHLHSKGVVIPLKPQAEEKAQQFEGAYVKDPQVGMHNWIVSFDLDSLYPHLIMQYNISPETKDKLGKRNTLSPDYILNPDSEDAQKQFIRYQDHYEYAQKHNTTIAANGVYFTRAKQGFLPELMETMYGERKLYKEKMLEAKRQLKALPDTASQAERDRLEFDITKYHNFQLVRKIQLNSAFGAVGNPYFRYYDIDCAEAITVSGKLAIRWIEQELNKYLNKMAGTTDVDFVVASDTDSVYLCLDKVVQKIFTKPATDQKITEVLEKLCKDKIEPYITTKYEELAARVNAYDQKMRMKRESICSKGIWTAKKRYMLNVMMGEDGVLLKEPELKIMGIETARSSTPQIVRQALKTAIGLIMNKGETAVKQFVQEFQDQFNAAPVEEIAFPRSVTGMEKYSCKTNVYKKSTPIAVKGSLLFNHFLTKHGLDKKYRLIGEADKIKFIYLKEPNPLSHVSGKEQVISFMNQIPKELHLDKYVNRDLQFEKSFKEPLKTILDVLYWSIENQPTLEDFFV